MLQEGFRQVQEGRAEVQEGISEVQEGVLEVQRGLRVNWKDRKQPDTGDNHRKALEHAIQADDADTLRQLIDAGADPEQYDPFGYTPLMLAAQLGSVKCTEALLAAGVDPFKKDRSPYSRKTAIAHTSSLPVVRLLAAAGNDINDLDTESDIRAYSRPRIFIRPRGWVSGFISSVDLAIPPSGGTAPRRCIG